MIEFTKKEDNKQLISISITDGTDTKKVSNYIFNIYPIIKECIYKMDNNEILLNLENNINYGFSLNALRSTVAEVAKAYIYNFSVDIDETEQRYCG